MANTLKFGNGQWATKVGSTLAYNDEGGNFKPLPFNFTRSTSATRVNKDGLIEVVTNNKPRIDFLNDSNGALLLEPARTNSLLQSNQFNTTWITTNASVTSGQAGYDGTNNAWELTSSLSGGNIFQTNTQSGLQTFSVYAKGSVSNGIRVYAFGDVNANVYFNLNLGTIGVILGSGVTAKIEAVGGGWYRCSITFDQTNTTLRFYPSDNANAMAAGTIYIQNAQIEAGSYATSYIPTQGATATRVAEVCTQTPPSGIIGQTEGTILLDFEFIAPDGVKVLFNLDGNANNKRIEFWMNGYVLNGFIGGSVNIPIGNITITEGRYKAAIAYNELGNQAFYVNGVQIGISTTPYTISNLDNLRFNVWNGSSNLKTSIKTKDIKLYNTRLSNTELQQLTTL